MRVVHIGTGALPVAGNTGRSVEETIFHLTRHLAESGCKVDVVDVAAEDNHGTGDGVGHGVRFHRVWSPPLSGANLLSYFLKVIIFSLQVIPVLRKLSRERVDIVHAHSQFPAAAVLLARRLFGLKVPLVYTAHNPHLLTPASLSGWLGHLLIEGWVLRRADGVVTQTEAVGKVLAARFGLSERRTIQVYAGYDGAAVDEFLRHHPRKAADSPLVLCPGIINPRKNQMALIESAPAIKAAFPECRFVFPGKIDDPRYFGHLRHRTGELGLTTSVDFPGHLPSEQLFGLYRDATVFVFPTLQESQGKVLIEAMAFGLPVIASRIGPISDVVRLDEGSAVLVDPSDPEAIARETVRLLGDASLRTAMSATAKKLAHSRFSWSRVAQDMLEAYEAMSG